MVRYTRGVGSSAFKRAFRVTLAILEVLTVNDAVFEIPTGRTSGFEASVNMI